MLRNVPCFSMYFGFNAAAKEAFSVSQNRQPLQLWQLFVAGAAAGLGFWGFLYPLDVIKSRMQVRMKNALLKPVFPSIFFVKVQPSERSERKYRNILDCAQKMLKEEGSSVFVRGYVPAMVRAELCGCCFAFWKNSPVLSLGSRSSC